MKIWKFEVVVFNRETGREDVLDKTIEANDEQNAFDKLCIEMESTLNPSQYWEYSILTSHN